MLSIFGQRFMSIAEQMGRRLQRTALSTNIKEKLWIESKFLLCFCISDHKFEVD